MITDIILSRLRRDPTLKRHLAKSISWRIIGTLDTVLLGFVFTGRWSTGLSIGGMELFTKMLLYFLHERVWHRFPYGRSSFYRRQLKAAKLKPNLFHLELDVNRSHREALNGHPAFTIWMTGLSGSGKSTLANALDKWLHERQARSYVIDGDNTRLGINSDLNFSREGRKENIRRVAEVCKLFNEAGVITICAFISPFRDDRRRAREIIGDESFLEVYIDATLETCKGRDPKGLYKKALAGQVKDFTGVSSPYEAPEHPDFVVPVNDIGPDESLELLKEWLLRERLA